MADSQVKHIRKVAVLGAGVMGAQIAAHCVNAKVPVVLFDLAKDGNAIVQRAIKQLQKLKPAPLASNNLAKFITPANYDDNLDLLEQCDIVIEAIAERLDWKQELYKKIAPALRSDAIFATNTSGLSINSLAEALPQDLRKQFCGVHFFNPPRYMPLVELIPTSDTEPDLLNRLESFLATTLGKGVVRAKDTPNFIGNRIGVFGILSIFHHTLAHGLSFDLVDDLTGSRLGRAKSGTFRTADVVGLDTLAHVINTMQEHLPDDPFHPYFLVLPVLSKLIEQGALGQKTGAGFYKKEGKKILRLDPETGTYVPSGAKADPEIQAILREPDVAKRIQALHASEHPQAKFVWAVLRDVFHYSAVHLATIADSARELDQAMKWGFGHELGPFELWQAAGWQQIANWINKDIKAGKTLSAAPLPDWVTGGEVWRSQMVHTKFGSFSPALGGYKPRSNLPVYKRQVNAPRLVGESAALTPNIVKENDAFMCWTLANQDPDVLLVSLKTKMHTLSPDAVAGILEAVELAEKDYKALVIGQLSEPFSAGADLKAMLPAFSAGGPQAVAPIQKRMQDMAMRVRYAQVPVVAALSGMALGGGCELALYCDARVAHLETYIGLVEAGIGVLPGAGGLAYVARHAAAMQAQNATGAQLLAYLNKFILNIATAKVSTSAYDAVDMGFLSSDDPIVMNRNELLLVAINKAKSMALQGYRPPMSHTFPVAGRDAIATIKAQLVNMYVGKYISEHDRHIAEQIAYVACGGDVDPGTLVNEAWIHKLERDAFLGLLATTKTQERITSFLQTGKPVRN